MAEVQNATFEIHVKSMHFDQYSY